MRTIKFRGITLGTKEMVFGFLNESKNIAEYDDVFSKYRICGNGENRFVIPDSVGQFTGLKDKNGKEIYEGDILGDWTDVDGKMEQSKQTVFFHEEEGQWMLDNSFHQDRSHFFSLAGELKDFEYEIIGNIHENPELTT